MSRSGLSTLHDRLARKIESRRAIQLTLEDLDWLVVSGAYGTIVRAAVAEQVSLARARLEARGEDLAWLDAPSAPAAPEQEMEAGAKRSRP